MKHHEERSFRYCLWLSGVKEVGKRYAVETFIVAYEHERGLRTHLFNKFLNNVHANYTVVVSKGCYLFQQKLIKFVRLVR